MASGVGTTHHVKLGNEFLIIRPNSYQKRPAPTFGARVSSGDPDYNNLSVWQHWVQKCWVGGMDAWEWVDDSMFDSALGVDTTNHEQAMLSRHLIRGAGTGWNVPGNGTIEGYRFATFKDVLYCLVMVSGTGVDSRLYAYNGTNDSWVEKSMPTNDFLARSICVFNGKLYIGGGGGTARLYSAATPGTWSTVANPAGTGTQGIWAMRVYNSKLYVAYGTKVWRHKSDNTWDGNAVFYEANASSESNYINAMETHLGFLYMLSNNGHIHRTDGNNTFDIWSWDGQAMGVSLRSFDGKLFVGTYEFTDTKDYGDGVLYQFTGAAVTELKRWGKIGKSTNIGQMITYGRRLYYGASSLLGLGNGFGVACYDPVEDAHSIYAIQDDTTTYPDASGTGKDWIVDDLIVYGGKMFVAVRNHGVFYTPDSFADVQRGVARYTTSTNGGWIMSSLYDAGTPGMWKLWNQVIVYCDLPSAATSFIFSYSIDGGVTWTARNAVAGPSADNDRYIFYLQATRSSRFQWKVKLVTTDTTKTPTLRGVVVAYLPQPEPNWMWSFTIPVADKWVLMDGTVETKNTNTLIAYLEDLFRDQLPVTFVDVDNVQWTLTGPGVLVWDLSTVHYDIESPREADLRITLLETVESY